MFLHILKDRQYERLYIRRSIRKENGTKSVNIKSLGRIDVLMDQYHFSREQVLDWAQEQVNQLKQSPSSPVILSLSPDQRITIDQQRSFRAGYLFLQSIYYDLKMKNIFRNISSRNQFDYDIDAICSDLVYARVLEPASKLSSYKTASQFLEQPKYKLHDVYRSLGVLSKEMDYILSEVYKNSNFIVKRNNKVLYYDCTNYFFEIEEEDDFRQYGKSKEHRPNPIVQMGLFMDADGIPLTFDLFEGASNEQPSMKPLEQKIIRDFGFDKFVVCTDGGLGSENNRLFNTIEGRAFICAQSLKKLKTNRCEEVMRNERWKRLRDHKAINIDEIRKNPHAYVDELYFKEEPYSSKKVPDQLMIVTYSPRYAIYQSEIRKTQLSRAKEMVKNKSIKKRAKNPNDPARFIKRTSTTADGEVANEDYYEIDQKKVDDESMYDGFYAVCTDLVNDSVESILKISEGRWQIEESFRIMKTDFEARPVYVRKKDSIRAHFLTCYLALLIFRILEKKTKKANKFYTSAQLIKTLREYRLLKVSGEGYIPEYIRMEITDHLHETFGFRTDTEIVPTRTMRKIIANTKK